MVIFRKLYYSFLEVIFEESFLEFKIYIEVKHASSLLAKKYLQKSSKKSIQCYQPKNHKKIGWMKVNFENRHIKMNLEKRHIEQVCEG